MHKTMYPNMWQIGAVIQQHLNSLKNVLASSSLKSLYLTKHVLLTATAPIDYDATTVVASNISATQVPAPHHAFGMLVGPSLAIADTSATLLFLTKCAQCQNKWHEPTPISITLPDSHKIFSLHICNILIPGPPTILTGHIMPDMTTATLFGIRILSKAGCKVIFDDTKC